MSTAVSLQGKAVIDMKVTSECCVILSIAKDLVQYPDKILRDAQDDNVVFIYCGAIIRKNSEHSEESYSYTLTKSFTVFRMT